MWRLVAGLSWIVAGSSLAHETVRIHVGERKAPIEVKGTHLQWGPDIEDGSFVSLEGADETVVVSLDRKQLRLGRQAIPGDSFRIRSFDGEQSFPIVFDGRALRGDLVIRLVNDKLQLINVLGLEEYLIGVLGSEMPKSYPASALQAQAIAARTYALSRKIQFFGSLYHLGSDVLSQVYGGLAAEDPRTSAAVEATRGIVLTYDSTPIEAYFHASCGGRTESGLDALSRDLPYLQSVDCPCGQLPASHWTAKVSHSEWNKLFGPKPHKSSRWQVMGRTATGRVIRLKSDAGMLIDARTVRQRLGYQRVKSLQFEIKQEGNHWALRGLGYGHGAGLCQWGARLMADQGWSFEQILEHYYPGTELQSLY